MLGGRIIGEGVDGCILSEPMWPCSSSTQSAVNAKDGKYVSKVVSSKDKETENLKMAARILGPDLSARYIAGIQGECAPADKVHTSSLQNSDSMKAVERAVLTWPKKGQACATLKDKLVKGQDISKNSKVMIISKYDATISGWIETLQKPYKTTLKEIERAIPHFMVVLQKLYQGHEEQLIHIDLHTGNIFVRLLGAKGLELGLADFGRCMFRRHNVDPSKTFYGEYLIDYLSVNEFFSSYSQIPLESRLLNFCYRKNFDNATPSNLVKAWENDNTVRMDAAGSCDLIAVNRSQIVSHLLKRVLFIAMVEQIQAISKKLRANSRDHLALYQSLSSNEKIVIQFILTRYSILSPINTITEEIMNRYSEKLIDAKGNGTNSLVKFLMLGIAAPYDQEGSSLVKALSTVEAADMGIIWADVIRTG